MESLAPVLVDDMELLVDLMPERTHVVVAEPERVRSRAHDLVATSQEFLEASWAAAAGGGEAPIDLGPAAYRTLADVRRHALEAGLAWWSVSPFALEPEDAPATAPLRTETGEIDSLDVDVDTGAVESHAIAARAVDTYRGDTERALADVRDWLADGWRVVLVTEGHGPAKRLVERAARATTSPARLDEDLDRAPERRDRPRHLRPARPRVRASAALGSPCSPRPTSAGRPGASTKDMRRMPARRRRSIDPLQLHRRPRRARAARRGPLRRDGRSARSHGAHPRVPGDRVRPGQARSAGRPALRPHRPARPGHAATSAGSRRASTGWAASDWAKRKGRARKAVKRDRR